MCTIRGVLAIVICGCGFSSLAGCSFGPDHSRTESQISPTHSGKVVTEVELARYPSHYSVGTIVGEIAPRMNFRNRALGENTGARLWIVDGVPMANASGGLLARDVVRIEVRDDAASTAYYGFQGNSGAILITTKLGATRSN
jgi:hypothetical protein